MDKNTAESIFPEESDERDSRYIILLSAFILFVTLTVFWLWSRKRQARTSVLLVGLCDSGKTLIFSRLLYSQHKQTYTSAAVNSDDFLSVDENSSLRIVDIPGHERLRGRYFEFYRATAKGIVFVIDSLTLQKDVKDAAEYLYTILSDEVIMKSSPAVLIVCNKQDQIGAKGSQVIKTLLEKEINLVRSTKSRQLQSVDPSQNVSVAYLGKQGKDFEFAHLHNYVTFAECCAFNGDPEKPVDINALRVWLTKLK